MSVTTNRIQPLVQILQGRLSGKKYTYRLDAHYSTGQSNAPEYRLRIANHYLFPASGEYPEDSGRLTFSAADSYWQGNKLQAKEVANANPNALSMDTATDGAYLNLHGFTLESIPAGGYRDVLVKINGTGLSFDDLLEVLTLAFPS